MGYVGVVIVTAAVAVAVMLYALKHAADNFKPGL
jgi:hypothetical protein